MVNRMDKRIIHTQRFRYTWQLTVVVLMSWLLAGCGVNNIPTYDEQVKAAWSQVENQYQRRADLIPNLVETVKGFARQEQETLTAVVEARAKATSIPVDASTLDDQIGKASCRERGWQEGQIWVGAGT